MRMGEGGADCLVRLNSLGEDSSQSGSPWHAGDGDTPACPCQAFQPHCAENALLVCLSWTLLSLSTPAIVLGGPP